MQRLLMKDLVQWKNSPKRKPLLLKGARQVGKTWLMQEFGRLYFSDVVYINFDKNKQYRDIFLQDYDVARILRMLNVASKVRIVPEKTLIIFDEIQEAPEAISCLKYFCEDAPEYPVIAAGSLLGVAIHKGISFPVGKIQTMHVYPLSFAEFLSAMNEDNLVEPLLAGDCDTLNLFSKQYDQWLRLYYYIGGMPEAVSDYAANGDVVSVRDIQREILGLYEDDFGKHADHTELSRIRLVWNAIPLQLAKENKKFFFGAIKAGARAKDYETALEWLVDCGLIYRVYRVDKPALPLKSYLDFSSFKVYLVDVGLLGAMVDLDAEIVLNGNRIYTEFKGTLTEQYVLQELRARTPYIPYYFSNSSHNEIDFMIQKSSEIIPIEVKAEVNVHAKSLKAYHEKYAPTTAVRTSMLPYKKEEWLTNVPLYAISII